MGLSGDLSALIEMSGAISDTGGSEVVVTPILDSGTKIASISIDDTSKDLYAPTPDQVSVTQIQSTGTKIATISVGETDTDLYAPSGGGGGSDVSYTQVLGSGTKIGTISIDSDLTDIYAPTPPTNINDLSDVVIANPRFNDALLYNQQSGKWINSAIPQYSYSLGELQNVTITTPVDGQVLKYDSTSSKWINANESGGGGGGIDYSTTEQDTGLTWVDGRPIYQKTYYVDGLTSGLHYIDVNFTSSLYDRVWITDIQWGYTYNGSIVCPTNYGGTGGRIECEVYGSSGLYLSNNTGVDADYVYVTLRYTKTADLS